MGYEVSKMNSALHFPLYSFQAELIPLNSSPFEREKKQEEGLLASSSLLSSGRRRKILKLFLLSGAGPVPKRTKSSSPSSSISEAWENVLPAQKAVRSGEDEGSAVKRCLGSEVLGWPFYLGWQHREELGFLRDCFAPSWSSGSKATVNLS